MKFKRVYSSFIFILFVTAISGQTIPAGYWIGSLDYDEVKCPIRFEIATNQGVDQMIFVNGKERVSFEMIYQGDSIIVPLKPFDAYISLNYNENAITGTWNKPYRDMSFSFSAVPSAMVLETELETENEKWKMVFNEGENGQYPGIGLIERKGSNVCGTILTETGDYRFFEGTMIEDSITMSAFDGTHGFLVVGRKGVEGWAGKLYFERGYSEKWTASLGGEIEISDPFEMVNLEGEEHEPYYDLLGAGSGKNSIDVSKFEGKVLIIQVLGTWCPNSLDQTKYLLDWYDQRPEGVEVLAVTYEPNYSTEYGLRRINEYTAHLEIPYEMVLGGPLSKTQAALPFPFMRKIEAFPTLVLVDKQGFARYVHSYFNGPATGDYYEAFKIQFNEKINELVAE